MTPDYREALSELKAFTAANPQIKIRKGLTVIPAESRDEFYRLFNATRLEFAREKTPGLYRDAMSLSQAFRQAAGEIKEKLGISEIKMPSDLNWMTTDPENGIIRPLFDPLFNLLKGEIGTEEFEETGTAAITAFCTRLYKAGYEKWLILSLALALEPYKAMAVPWEELKTLCHELQPDEKRGFAEQNVPNPETIETLLMGHEGYDPSFMIADLIVRSDPLDRWVAFGADLTDAGWSSKGVAERREWITIRPRAIESKPRLEWPDMVIYMDERVQDISLIADFGRFGRPEIILEVIERPGAYGSKWVERVKRNYDFFAPRLGAFVICRDDCPEEVTAGLNPPAAVADEAGQAGQPSEPQRVINIISGVGFDSSKLEPVIKALRDMASPPVEPEPEAAG